MATNEEFSAEFKKRIYNFILKSINFLESLTKNDEVCRVARNQAIRSVTSIGSNYIEAIAAGTKKEFALYLGHSLKSANETKFWYSLLRDTGKSSQEQTNDLLKELIEIANILGASIRTLRKK